MNFLPILGFYWRQHEKLHRMTDRANVKEGVGVRLLVDLAEANAPILKDRFPHLTENNFLSDAIQTLKDATTSAPPPMKSVKVKPSAHMSQAQLEAGADGIHRVAERYGMASFINRDQERELAAEVIQSYVATQEK